MRLLPFLTVRDLCVRCAEGGRTAKSTNVEHVFFMYARRPIIHAHEIRREKMSNVTQSLLALLQVIKLFNLSRGECAAPRSERTRQIVGKCSRLIWFRLDKDTLGFKGNTHLGDLFILLWWLMTRARETPTNMATRTLIIFLGILLWYYWSCMYIVDYMINWVFIMM